jgi:hypothetical protein
VRILNYNRRIAWAVLPAALCSWIGLLSVMPGSGAAERHAGVPPLGLELERGARGVHIPGRLIGIKEAQQGLRLFIELPPDARPLEDPAVDQHAIDWDSLLSWPESWNGFGQPLTQQKSATSASVEIPGLPGDVEVEVLSTGELSHEGPPRLDLLKPMRPILLPRGDQLVFSKHYAIRFGPGGIRLLQRPKGVDLRRWVKRLEDRAADPDAADPAGPP